jgi:hypothetical protein
MPRGRSRDTSSALTAEPATGWAEALARQTSGLTRDGFLPGAVPGAEGLATELLALFGAFDDPADRPILRVFVDGGQRFDLAGRLFPSRGAPGEDPEA